MSLPRRVTTDELLQLAEPLYQRLGILFSLKDATQSDSYPDPIALTCERCNVQVTRYQYGAASLSLRRESGDNGADDTQNWEPYFFAEGLLSGLPGGAVLRLTGNAWAANSFQSYEIVGGIDASNQRIEEALFALLK